MELIDIGVNLGHDCFDADRNEVIARARAAGVVGQIITGTDLDGSRRAAELAAVVGSGFWSTAGVHPHHASDWTDHSAAEIEALLGLPQVVAVGECGLDYFRNYSPREAQQLALQAQLSVAAARHCPVFLHQRDAHADLIKFLEPRVKDLPAAVVHCFTGNRNELMECLELGCYIGITGWICDERRGQALYEMASAIPEDRLLLETDAPYLLPRSLSPKPKSRRNEPMYLSEVCRVVAQARGQSAAAVAQLTTQNARRFFGL